jgi:hypothetical protein
MLNRTRATWRIWVVLWLLAALQSSVLGRWRPWNIEVDWLLMSVVSVSILLGWPVGGVYGLAAGWLCGTMAGVFPGSFSISRALVGAIGSNFSTHFSLDNPLGAPLGAFTGTVVANSAFALMSPSSFPMMWWVERTLLQAPLHAVLVIPLHAILARRLRPPARRFSESRLG